MTEVHGITTHLSGDKAAGGTVRCRGVRPSLSEQLHWFRPPKFTRLSHAGVAQLHQFFLNDESNADIARRMGLTEAAIWSRRKAWLKTRGDTDDDGGDHDEADHRRDRPAVKRSAF